LFEKDIEEAVFLSPLENFERDPQPIQYRKDPLTGMRCRINVKRTLRLKQGREGDVDFSELVEMARKNCFFCPENMEKATPKFTEDISQEGRINRGESWVFPNLFPFAQYHAVGTITRRHFLEVKDFTRGHISDTIHASLDFFRRVHKVDPEARYPAFNWNYLPSSGASIIHPHVQLIADKRPTYLTSLFLERSAGYFKEHGRNYWEWLVEEEERLGERFIKRTGNITWLASFVPLGNTEVQAVFEGISNLFELSDEDIGDLAGGLKNVLSAYHAMGKNSFNMSTYSAPVDEGREDYSLNMRIISRPDPLGYYTTDTGYMETLHHERVVESMPEVVAAMVKDYF
jgi:galactose-1-phosphate uridylyltransferase